MGVKRSCAKKQKIASTPSPCTKPGHTSSSCLCNLFNLPYVSNKSVLTLRDYACFSGYGARKPHDREPVKLRVGSEPLSSNLGGSYILVRGATLSLQVKKKVEEKVQAIQPKLPIFVKEMTRSNVDGTGCRTCEMVSLTYSFIYSCKYVCSSQLIILQFVTSFINENLETGVCITLQSLHCTAHYT